MDEVVHSHHAYDAAAWHRHRQAPGIEAEVGIVVEGDLSVGEPARPNGAAPGIGVWLAGLTPHDIRNEGQRPARLYEIFLKHCDEPELKTGSQQHQTDCNRTSAALRQRSAMDPGQVHVRNRS